MAVCGKKVYTIDGMDFDTLEGFYHEIGKVLLPDVTWGRNLDAFNDILRGGFGTSEEGFILRWKNADISRIRLGYGETIRQLEARLRKCHPTNTDHVQQELAAAKRQEGDTVFDWLVAIIETHGGDGPEGGDGVTLLLE